MELGFSTGIRSARILGVSQEFGNDDPVPTVPSPFSRATSLTLFCASVLAASFGCTSKESKEADAIAATSPSTVDSSAPSEPATLPKSEGGKIAARAMDTGVFEGPSPNAKKIGYLRAGAVVATRGGVASKEGCPGGWIPIAPRGFVCVGAQATGNLDDAIVKASTRRPDLTAGLPYGYAVVRTSQAPFYTRIPTEAEAKALEPDWDKHFRTLEQAESDEAKEGAYPQLSSLPGGAFPIEPTPGVLAAWATDGKDDPTPNFLSEGAKTVPNLSGLVFSHKPDADAGSSCPGGAATCIPLDAARPMRRLGISFIASIRTEQRRYLLTPDLLLMPADRVRMVRGTSFHGVELSKGEGALNLPIVFVTKPGAKRYSLEGKHLAAGAELPWRGAFEVEKKQKLVNGEHFHVLKDGTMVNAKESARLEPIKKLPKWGKEGERWIEINLAKQTLLAVEGDTPVYATMVSTGAGGMSDDAEKNPFVTPKGIFRIHTKHVASTMDSRQPEAEFELRDVPYIQYFKDGYALHAAYWHDQFGTPRSHGCINLAPKDAAKLFGFTKPEVPEGWHGAMLPLRGSVVWIHN